MNRDILKNPILCGAKNSNKFPVPSGLVKWIPHTVDMVGLVVNTINPDQIV